MSGFSGFKKWKSFVSLKVKKKKFLAQKTHFSMQIKGKRASDQRCTLQATHQGPGILVLVPSTW